MSFYYDSNNPSRLVFLKFWIRRIAETFLEVLTKRSKHENCLLEPLDPIKRQQRSLNAKFPVSLACPVSRFLCERRYWLRVVLSLLFIDCRILGTTGCSAFGKNEDEWWLSIPSISWDVSKRSFTSTFPLFSGVRNLRPRIKELL